MCWKSIDNNIKTPDNTIRGSFNYGAQYLESVEGNKTRMTRVFEADT